MFFLWSVAMYIVTLWICLIVCMYTCIHVYMYYAIKLCFAICEMPLLGCQGYIHKNWLSPCEVYNHQFQQYCICWELNWYLLSFFKFTLEWKLIQSFLKDIDTNDMKFIRFTREYMKTSNYDWFFIKILMVLDWIYSWVPATIWFNPAVL